jgi:hypothetical protein
MRFTVLIVIFLGLMVVFSAYSVVYTQGLPTETHSTITVAVYSLQGSYNYQATLGPNTVYNTTTLSLGQGSLFVAITKTINVTYTCTASLSEPADFNLGTSYLMTLSGGAWNKTLSQTSQSAQQNGTYSFNFSKSFMLNVTQTVALAKEIGTELQVTTPTYLVQIKPETTGSLVGGGRTVPLYFVDPMNLTFAGGVITPSGTSYFHQGNVTSEVFVTYGSTNIYRYVSYGLLVASLVLLGSGVYLVRSEKGAEPAVDDMATLTQPYREVIASTTSLPEGASKVAMGKWEDLVKVADTMGKPILEFVDKGVGYIHYVYWVRDGDLAYVFETTSKQMWVT